RHSGRIATKPWSLTWLSTLDLDPTSINHYRKILRAQIWPHWGRVGGIGTGQVHTGLFSDAIHCITQQQPRVAS
ncbi:hypothetical protein KBZ21_41515, partial [Streptomyces sp. A73]|nr:hypothetical protein [Streptomyces sp. A73]